MRSPAAWWARALEHQEHRDARAPGRTWDLRLVPAALGAWLAGLLGARIPLPQAVAGAALYLLVLVLGAALVIAAARALRRDRPARRAVPVPGVWRSVPWSAAALSALAVTAVLLSAGANQREIAQGVLGEVLDEGGSLAVTAGVAEPPRRWSAPGTGPWDGEEDRTGVVLELELDTLTHRGRSVPVDVPATVFADGPGWAGLTPGDRITAVLTATGQQRPGAVVLRAEAPPTDLPDAQPTPRDRVRERFVLATAGMGPDAAGLLPGMTFGERSGLGPELEQDMRDTGLTHLTAVSGANCALVTALAGHAALSVGASRRTCLVVGLGALAVFVVLVGPDPSVLRAAAMGGLAALSLLTGRTAVSLATLSGAVVALVVARPAIAAEYGFILSVLATAGIVVSGRPMTRWLGARMPEGLAVAVAVPAAAQLWSAPVVVLLQPAVPVYSLPANVLAAPLVPVVTVCGLAGLLLLLPPDAGPAAALLPLSLAAAGARLIAATARAFAGAPGALAPWPDGVAGVLLMAGLSAAALAVVHALDLRRRRPRPTTGSLRDGAAPPAVPEQHWVLRERRRRSLRTAAAGAVLLVVVLLAARAVVDARRPPPPWEAVLCDVGQGDAVLLRTAPGRAVLVDTGPDPRSLERCLELSGVVRLDLVVLTHSHADHTGGLPALARSGGAGELWYSTAEPEPPRELATVPPGTPVHRPARGQSWASGDLRLTVLAPATGSASPYGTPSSSDENNASLVLRAELTAEDGSTTSWLLTGDLEDNAARSLVRTAGPLVDVDVLKVAHHGSRDGGTGILDAASPRLAAVSAGRDNDYGHPHPLVLTHLERMGVPLLRTDEHGSVALVRDGDVLRAVPLDP